jgi:PPP family 3-phenylpropionic acid transporter
MNAFKFSAIFQMAMVSIASLLPLYWKNSLGYTESEVGYLNALSTLILLGAPFIFGFAGSRYRPEVIIFICFGASALLSPLFLSSDLFSVQSLLFGLLLFMRTGIYILVPVGVMHLLGPRSGNEYGKYRRFGSLGFLSGVISGGYLIEATWPGSVVWLISICAVLAALPYYKKIKIPFARMAGDSFWSVLKIKGLKSFYIGTFLMCIWWSVPFVFLPLRLNEMGASAAFTGWIVSLLGITALISLPLMGSFADRYIPERLYFWLPLLGLLRCILTALPQTNPYWFILIQLMHIPTWVLGDILQVKILKTYVPVTLFSRAQAFLIISTSGGMAIGSAIIGLLVEQISLAQSFIWAGVISLSAMPLLYGIFKRPLSTNFS